MQLQQLVHLLFFKANFKQEFNTMSSLHLKSIPIATSEVERTHSKPIVVVGQPVPIFAMSIFDFMVEVVVGRIGLCHCLRSLVGFTNYYSSTFNSINLELAFEVDFHLHCSFAAFRISLQNFDFEVNLFIHLLLNLLHFSLSSIKTPILLI